MHSSDLSGVRRDLAEWSGPLIADRVNEFYSARFGGDMRLTRPLARQHCRLWHNILLQEDGEAQNARRELVRLGRLTGLDSHALDRLDELVLDELIEVVTARFHRSPTAARDYNRSLVRAASRLVEARIAP